MAHNENGRLNQTIFKFFGNQFEPEKSSIAIDGIFGQVSMSSTIIANTPYVLLWKDEKNSSPEDI